MDGQQIHALIRRLYPICRSITGNGVRETLGILGEHLPLEVHEVPTGTQVFDWTVPREWNIRDAWVKDEAGQKVIDFRKHNLHIMSYSTPFHEWVERDVLEEHLHTLPDDPDWIPYRTSYYKENWGFCLSEKQKATLGEGRHEVFIDSSLQDGALTYGELSIPGRTPEEVLFFTHVCHPSLCNDNLSGVGVATALARRLLDRSSRYSYRFVFAPATIGSITWLSRNQERLDRIRHGLVIAVVGDSGAMTYKKSRHDNAEIDRAVLQMLRQSGRDHEVLEFGPWGYDERQFCSPGINLPVGRLTRTPNGCYPEYHTSADDLELVRPESLQDSLEAYLEVVRILEGNRRFVNREPFCEPQLGRRGLYGSTGGHKDVGRRQHAMLWVLNLSDGNHSLLDICERSGLAFDDVEDAARALQDADLLAPAETKPRARGERA